MSQFFSLFDYTKEIKSLDMAAAIAQGTAWKIDTSIQAACRQIARELPKDAMRTIDAEADIDAAIAEMLFAEDAIHSAGCERGLFEDIRELLHVREACHRDAAELTAFTLDWQGRPRTYEIPDIEELFFTRPEMSVKDEVRMKVRAHADFLIAEGELDAGNRTEFIKASMTQVQNSLESVADRLEENGPLYLAIYRAVTKGLNAPGEVIEGFQGLRIELQAQLIAHAMKTAERKLSWALKDNNLAVTEFMAIQISAMKIKKDLTLVLSGARFARATA